MKLDWPGLTSLEREAIDALKAILHWEACHRRIHRHVTMRCVCGARENSEKIARNFLEKYEFLPESERR